MRLSSRRPAQRALTLLQFQQLLLCSMNHAEDVAALAELDDGHALTEYAATLSSIQAATACAQAATACT